MRLALLVVVAVIAAGVGYVVGHRTTAAASPPAQEAAEDADAAPRRIVVARVRRASLTRHVVAFGTVGTTSPRVVAASIDGEVIRLPLPVGAAVARGAVLAELSPTPATRAARAEALAGEQAAAKALEVVDQRLAAGLATVADRQQAEQAAASARRLADDWRARLPGDRTTLVASDSGVVTAVATSPGQWVSAGTELLRLTGDRTARFGLEPLEAASVVVGTQIAISAPRRPDVAPLTARVDAVAAAIDPESRLVDAVAALPDTAEFAVGESLRGEFAIATPPALIVPRAAIAPAQGGRDGGVFVIGDGHVHLHAVAVIAAGDDDAPRADVGSGAPDLVAITVAGVTEADSVAVSGVNALADGDAVEAVARDDAATPPAASAESGER